MDREQLKRHIHKSDLTAMEKRYLEEIVDGTRWIPCSERMPEVGLTVHVYAKDSDVDYQFDAYATSTGEWYTFDEIAQEDYTTHAVSHNMKITHWMPLPEPPEV